MRSILRQDYPDYEIIAIDDRSEDATGAILDRLSREDPRLRVVHVRELPPGWLGKNHALHAGAAAASGELILFTDADVVMEPATLRRAARYMAEKRLDHMVVIPKALTGKTGGGLLKAVLGATAMFWGMTWRPWRCRIAKSAIHVGIGAFNLVRAEPLRALGGLQPIALRPDDDLKLGKLFKKNGHRQDFLFGAGAIEVEWYSSTREYIRGLMKNTFAGADYSIARVVIGTALLAYFFLLPPLGLILGPAAARIMYGATLALLLLLYADNAPRYGLSPWMGFAYPVGLALLGYIFWRSMILTLARGGIEWRGTRYPLELLKANRI